MIDNQYFYEFKQRDIATWCVFSVYVCFGVCVLRYCMCLYVCMLCVEMCLCIVMVCQLGICVPRRI